MFVDHAIQGVRLSPQQQRLWLLHGNDFVLRSVCRVALAGDIQPAVLDAAFTRVIARNEILRTVVRNIQTRAIESSPAE